jgi:muconolactone delta-isomerase
MEAADCGEHATLSRWPQLMRLCVLYGWMDLDTTPLTVHPNNPALQRGEPHA